MKLIRYLTVAGMLLILLNTATADKAYAQAQRLTTTIVAIVKAAPVVAIHGSEAASPRTAELVALAKAQVMTEPSIVEHDDNGRGQKVYTIVDRI
ncbi:MAG: hypothetical protein PHS37_08460 [Candidatus Omnitrophica bacterium]|nr:hypothetical protein [Candidatus Omnitrophota bacterium]